jgi:hypothetical protein
MSAGSLAIGSAGASIASSVLSAFGDIYQGKAQAAQYKYQAGVAQAQEYLSKSVYLPEAVTSTGTKVYNIGTKGAEIVGQEKAGFGAGNVAGGSVNAVTASQTRATQIAESNEQTTGAREVQAQQIQGAFKGAQVGAELAGATTATEAAEIGAGGSILGGAGQAGTNAAKWAQYSNAPTPDSTIGTLGS